jgi:hypothetical protein
MGEEWGQETLILPLAVLESAQRDAAFAAGSLHAIPILNALRRRWALIRGRSHPIRFANGTWLAAHSAIANASMSG